MSSARLKQKVRAINLPNKGTRVEDLIKKGELKQEVTGSATNTVFPSLETSCPLYRLDP